MKEGLFRVTVRRVSAIVVGLVVFFLPGFLMLTWKLTWPSPIFPWVIARLFLAGFAAQWASPPSQSANARIVGIVASGWIIYAGYVEAPEKMSDGGIVLSAFLVFAGSAALGGYVATSFNAGIESIGNHLCRRVVASKRTIGN